VRVDKSKKNYRPNSVFYFRTLPESLSCSKSREILNNTWGLIVDGPGNLNYTLERNIISFPPPEVFSLSKDHVFLQILKL
jgi:hypothetical protein